MGLKKYKVFNKKGLYLGGLFDFNKIKLRYKNFYIEYYFRIDKIVCLNIFKIGFYIRRR